MNEQIELPAIGKAVRIDRQGSPFHGVTGVIIGQNTQGATYYYRVHLETGEKLWYPRLELSPVDAPAPEPKTAICSRCNGRGIYWTVDDGSPCQRCNGTGRVPKVDAPAPASPALDSQAEQYYEAPEPEHTPDANDFEYLRSEANKMRARIAELEAALKPFALAAEDGDVICQPSTQLRIGKWSKALSEYVYVPVHFIEDEGYEGSEPLMTQHLRAAAEAIKGKP